MNVFTGPDWLFNIFNGYKNKNNTATIKPIFDKFNRPVIGKTILNDDTWDKNLLVKNPLTNEEKPVIEWLEEILYEPVELEIPLLDIEE